MLQGSLAKHLEEDKRTQEQHAHKRMELSLSTITFGLRNPRTTALIVFLGKDSYLCRCIAQLVAVKKDEIQGCYTRIKAEDTFKSQIHSALAKAGPRFRGEVSLEAAYCLYTICRVVRPKIVVETGVAAGVSSAFILKALADNAHGKLCSIDLPNYEEVLAMNEPEYAHFGGTGISLVPSDKGPGFVVPNDLKERWELRLGLSSEVLPSVLSEAGPIDLFIHDSEHTYKNMMFEYETAWPSIKNGGLLLSHDVGWNSAFSDFGSRVNRASVRFYSTGLGGLRK